MATFEEHLVTGELLGCQQQLNYLLCWPCDAGQQYYYDSGAQRAERVPKLLRRPLRRLQVGGL